ncbi:hypothetical protein J4E85_007514 [Alternaria conjuncta]|uniref:uncharacterized protein n=1 Tax=Alternaria conjuncta TaxID=181017 RepID=UPI00221EF751|nr:uncharacterized protein J4E85_007514 [Alternaria conjuncta]KAI4925635.1 hypothetical protein J4E85_007514 [Alternaria conjuncta]
MAPKDRLTTKSQKLQKAQKIEIEERQKQLDALRTTQSALEHEKQGLETKYKKITDDCSRAWNRQFAARFLELVTARELRDEVYLYLIGDSPSATIYPIEVPLPANTMNDHFFHLQPIDRRGRSQRRGNDDEIAHYFRDKFVGEEFAVEIAQLFHRHAIYKVGHVKDVAQFLRDGPLMVHPSCQPEHYIRTLKVIVSMDIACSNEGIWYSKEEDNWKKENYESQLSWLTTLKELDQVSKFTLKLKVKVLDSSTISKYKAVLLPHIQELVEKGCKVTVRYISANMYQYPTEREKIIYDSTMLLSTRQMKSLVTDAFNNDN